MASKQTEELLAKIQEMLETHGITNYVIALNDPDAPVDCLRVFGSPWWRAGLATELLEDFKHQRIREWEDNQDEDS